MFKKKGFLFQKCLVVLLVVLVSLASSVLHNYSASAAGGLDVSSLDEWIPIMPSNAQFDYVEDQQTSGGQISSADLVGDETHRVFYVRFDEEAGEMGFRFRINTADFHQGNPTFDHFAYVGIDASLAGNIDFFVGVYKPTTNSGTIGVYDSDPSKLNTGPSTTGIMGNSPLFEHAKPTTEYYSIMPTNDGSNFSGNPDYFLTFKIALDDINLAIAGKDLVISSSSQLRYIVGTAQQRNSFNADIAGMDGIDTRDTRTWEEIGVFSPVIYPSGNTAPEASDSSTVVPPDSPASGSIDATDADGDDLSYSIKEGSGPAHGVASIDENGNWTYTPDPGFTGEDSFVVLVDDGQGGVIEVLVSITVTSSYVPPVAEDGNISTRVSESITGFLSASDPDGNSLTYFLVAAGSKGTVTVDELSGEFTYTPSGELGEDTFIFKVNDGSADSNTATITVTILAANTLPVVEAEEIEETAEAGSPVSGSIDATDADGDDLSYSIKEDSGPANGEASIDEDGNWSYTPDSGFTGTDSFIVLVDDGQGGVVEVIIYLNMVASASEVIEDVLPKTGTNIYLLLIYSFITVLAGAGLMFLAVKRQANPA